MNISITRLFFLLFCVFSLLSCKASYLKIKKYKNLSTNSYLIKNVNVVPMTLDTVLMQKSVLIIEGTVKSISDGLPADKVKIIDAKGKYLSPGLIDMHVHIWDKYELGLYVANGVTTVRNMLGMPLHLKLKRKINSGQLIGPNLFSASPEFTGINDKSIEKKKVKSPEQANKLVIHYKKKGFDYIKTYNKLPKDIFDATIEQARISAIPIVAHPSFEVNYNYHFNPAIATVEHTEDIVQQPLHYKLDSSKLQAVIDGFVNSKQTHCPTLIIYHNLTEIYNKEDKVLKSEQANYINPFIRKIYLSNYNRHIKRKHSDSTSQQSVNDQHKFHLQIVKKMHDAGINIIAGTDAGVLNTAAGFSLHQELELYKEAGMSNYEAIKTATVNPSKVFSEYEIFGTIQIGKRADLLLTENNPLDNLSSLQNPEVIFLNGRLIEKDLTATLKNRAYKRNNYVSTFMRMLGYIIHGKK